MTFYEKMRLVCLCIPRGKVATYGQIAMLCGKPGNSRQVGYGLRENLAGEDIPAFRVVNGRGELSGAQHFVISDLQRTLLAEDGVPTYWNGHCWCVDLKKYGCQVTVLEAAPALMMKNLNDTASAMLTQLLEDKGITVLTGVETERFDGETLYLKDGAQLTADVVIVSCGVRANGALAAEAGADMGKAVLVNEKMETSVPGVYAIGDCVFGHAQLAHTASAMGEVAAENICGHEAHYCEKTNPTCVYMEPEAASVGLTEEQCKAQGIAYKVGKFPMSANGKALILNGGEGIVKIIAGKQYGEILGMHIIGPRATDLIAEGALAIAEEMTLDEIISTIHSHPTVTETMREAALQAEGRAIHTSNR